MTLSKANPRAKKRWTLATVIVGALMLVGAGLTLAVHNDNLFELGPSGAAPFTATTATNIQGDGNTANGPDWADIFNAASATSGNAIPGSLATYGGSAAGFISDPSSAAGASDPSTFSGFGTSNKNTDPVSTGDCASRTPPLTGSSCSPWGWAPGNVPAKDDLTNVYAYATIPSNGVFANKLILYAGIERESPSGDSHVDVEFFQDQVKICNTAGCSSFLGNRTNGDVILSMDFLQGGALGSVTVREWDSALNTYVQEGVAAGVGCNAGDTICAFNNEFAITNGGWTSLDSHGHAISTLPVNAFTEVGVDVTDLFGGLTPCISTFMAKTRSSGSFTSELKDFAGPKAFPLCSAQISIAPNATNEVGANHTFTVTVQQKIGTAVSAAPDGTKPTVTLTGSGGITGGYPPASGDISVSSNTCASAGTVNGTCSITFTSSKAGQVTGSASATFLIGGDSFTVTTDGTGTNSGPAVKTFVDAGITLTPLTATNGITEPHTITAHVTQNLGQGGGFVAAPTGTLVTFSLLNNTASAAFVGGVNTCTTIAAGTCTVQINTTTAGSVDIHATTTFTVSGTVISVTRATDGTGNNSGNANKIFVAGSLIWYKDDNAGNPLGGATFQVCRTADRFGIAVSPPNGDCVTVADDTDLVVGPGLDQDPNPGVFKLTNLALGHYTVKETVAPAGWAIDPSTKTADLGTAADPTANKDATITVHFVDQRPIVKITGFGYTNLPVSATPTSGILNGTAVFTATLKNYGGAAATFSGTLAATSNTSAGTLTCTGGNTVTFTNVALAAGASSAPISITCVYNIADGETVTGTLNVSYTINGLTRTASGSPATITFTAQGD